MSRFDPGEPLLPEVELEPEAFPVVEPMDAAIRERMFAATLRPLAWRRARRRMAAAVAAVALFGLGHEVGQRRMEPPRSLPAPDRKDVADPAPIATVQPEPVGDVVILHEDPTLLEELALDAGPSERARLLRRAGDRYLDERGDVEAAVRCYRASLEIDPADAPEPNDSWLLAVLKQGHV